MKKKNQDGFNLVELLVSITIFGIISTLVIANLRGGSPRRDLRLQAANIASLLRQAQVQASAGEDHAGAVPVGGFGVHIDACNAPPCSVTLFADTNSNLLYDGGDEFVQTVSLGNGVTVEGIDTGVPAHITFKPPRPYACFNAVCSGLVSSVITLGSTTAPITSNVTINQVSGQITYD